jgi:hypothetical protein
MTPNDDMDDVTRAYRDARNAQRPDDGPPAALDDAIRAAARRAVQSRPQPVGQGWITRWRTPLSAAAVMVLAVSVVFVAIEEKPDVAPAAVQKAALELREAVPAVTAKKDAQDARRDAMAVHELAPLQTKIIPADSQPQVSPPEVQIASPALPREKKAMPAGSGAIADSNVAPRAEEAARNRAVAVAREKSNADLSAGRRDVVAVPPPAQAAVVGAVAAVAPVVVPAPAAPPVPPAPVIAFAPSPPAAAAPAPARTTASVSASAAAPVVSNTSPVMVVEGAKISEAVAKQARQEPAKPAEAADARYTAAARQAAKAEAARGTAPPPAAVAPQAVAAAKEPMERIEKIETTGTRVAPQAMTAKDSREPIMATGSRVAPPAYAPPAPPVKALFEQKESADAWIKRIEQLLKDNKLKEVREELARFRKTYPNTTLPPPLAKLPPE